MQKLAPDHLHQLLFSMLRIRRTEEAIAREYSQQEIRCPIHLCMGEEAVAAGVCANVLQEDIVMSMHRSHGHFLAKGGSLRGLIAELHGKATGVAGGYGGSQHVIDQSVNFLGATPIVASTIPVAVGTAFAHYLRSQKSIAGADFQSGPNSSRSDRRTVKRTVQTGSETRSGENQQPTTYNLQPITTVFFGEAAVEEGVVHESFNFAVLKQLPIFFVCENNQYSVNTPMRYRQPHRSVHPLARAHGMPAYELDGNDCVAISLKARDMIARIRVGGGPAFLECHTYRFLEHCGPLPDTGIVRSEKEVLPWQKKDPVERMKRYLKTKKLFSDQMREKMEKEIQKEIEDAFQFAKDSPFPKEQLREEMVYAKS